MARNTARNTGIDLERMNRDELADLRQQVEAAIADAETRRRDEALANARAAAEAHGFRLEELTGAAKAANKGRRPSPPKYRDPEDPAKSWTGRGRQPGWLKTYLDAGRYLDEFRI